MAVLNVPMMIAIFVAIFVLSCDGNVEAPPNPCPNVFRYVYDGREFYGIVTQKYTPETRIKITIEMTQPGVLNQNYKGKISPNIDVKRISDYINFDLPITYRVDFPQQHVLPRITNIMENDVTTCSGPKYSYESFLANSFHFVNNLTRADIKMTIILEEDTKSRGLKALNAVCGQENEPRSRLRKRAVPGVNGEVIEKSRFPWIAAIYIATNSGLLFQCGGTLISKLTVISDGACFCQTSPCSIKNELSVYLGRHNLNDYRDGMNIRVQTVVIHPDYRGSSGNLDASVALLQLANRVTFSHQIRPICLWEGPTDLDLIEGTTGVVVGWGEDETIRGSSALPKLVRSTIVSEMDCIRSNEIFSRLLSNRSFCAGNRDGSGQCFGDSGNGLMVRKKSKWILRGIVTASLKITRDQCNSREYALYSDTAKFIDWINANMWL